MTNDAPFHVGLTPELVVDTALELTEHSHLLGWSIRDLARRLDVTASVIYHHVGGKDLIARRVVERVLDGLGAPSADLPWDEYFRNLLFAAYPIVAAHPGVAKWLLMHGPTFPAALPILDRGIAALLRAGFGDQAGLAYATLLNTALLTITIGDDRLLHEEDGPRDHASMMAEFRDASEGSPGLQLLTRTLIDPFLRGGDAAVTQREAYYRFVVDTTITGLAAQLTGSGLQGEDRG
ncbi:XRE family transcriptional regulator [Mycetocola reblochoni]|uniref:XRE family transcriptional regulator n=1 Tax=Mycetocola reblochoni TaxID=331618 RepID=A0A3L6ZIE3_9MICO|nr:helix-turn-helix transcriptional regulator [Mycetocola reblochoni]RLP67760.1 XRE family transcriptional regulator [Mycetocola reblochoni]